ncbi:S8 family peptidase [Nonomuraea deserti]|uniref:S8 family peptidase n=1 Tax=Nonomuraea deserti TaxID=1848322 RepID=UPI0014045035|nr:S8 family serine peptidase [Nonomuraea deserti]
MRNRLLALLAAASLTVPLAAVPSGAAQAAAAPPEAAPPGLALDGLGGGPYTVTLVTGDRVTLTPGPDGRFSIDAVPAPRPDGSVPDLHYTSFGQRDAVYVVSHDVLEQIQAGRVDRGLFNVAYLAANGYADNAAKRLPLIVEYAGEQSPSALRGKPRELAATGNAVALESIGAAATTVDKAKAADFWKSVVGDRPAARSLQGGVERLWLDSVVRVTLEDSVPQVGAPQAWQAGLDGKGVKVAVLDTGIDENHPDVAGKIVASKSFIPDQEVKDGHGHGTHVAATVAGSGAASDGRRKGVAPGADLIVGKVLGDSGSSTSSSLIEGMEWAAGEMDADIVSLSLGGNPTDGKDPLSQAVDGLTESTGALFVVAAGNAGREFTISTPGTATSALTVGAVDKSDKLTGFSSRGPRLGDHAIKPEITAPGAAIVAARAAGTSLGSPVDDHYTSLNGTSMATPHVSGAAAILLQQHPGWTPAQVKTALTASAQDVGATVYQQGAGRLDVARAVGQNVQAGQATADFGFHRFPIDGDLSRTLSYTNSGDQPVTLALTATGRTDRGEPMPEGALALDRNDVTVPAGGTAQVTLTIDHSALSPATYTGSVVAATSDDAVRLTTPIGAVLGPELHDLTVRMIHSDNPRGWKKDALTPAIVYVAPIEGAEGQGDWIKIGGPRTTVDWEKGATVQVPAGTYTVFAPLSETWIDDTGAHQEARLIDPEVSVPSDAEVVLDAAEAVRVTYDTPRPSEGHNRSTMFMRWVPEDVDKRGFFVSWGDIALTTNGRRDNLWVTPTERVTKGEFTFATQTTRVAPTLTMTLQGRKPERLDAQYPIFGASLGEESYAPDPSKMFSAKQTLQLVDVGFGTPEELAAADVRGKLAMVRRDPAALNSILYWQCWPEEPTFRALIDAGAAGIVVGQNEYRDYPGPAEHYMSCDVPGLSGVVAPATFLRTMVNELPIVFVPFADADRLRVRAAAGEVRIAVEGTPRTPYYYQLKPHEEGHIPDRLHYDFSKRKLATVEHELHGSGWRAITFSAWKPYEPAVADNRGAQSLPPFAPAPWRVTEYLGPVASDTVVRHAVGDAGLNTPRQLRYDRFDRPGRTKVAWDDGPKVPAVAPPLAGSVPDGYPMPFIPSDMGLCSGCRQGDLFWPSLRYSTSPDPHQIGQEARTHFGQFFGDETVRLERADGTEVPQVADPYIGDLLSYRLPPEPGRYRLTHQFDQTTTTWTFNSQTAKKDSVTDGYRCTGTWLEHWGNFPRTETPCRPEPLIFLRYDLGLDLSGQVTAGRKHRFTVTADRQPGKGHAPAVTGLDLQVSYDGGGTWTKAKVRPRGKGEFTAEVRHPGSATGPVTVRAEAWDRAGNRVAQTITAAFTLKK